MALQNKHTRQSVSLLTRPRGAISPHTDAVEGHCLIGNHLDGGDRWNMRTSVTFQKRVFVPQVLLAILALQSLVSLASELPSPNRLLLENRPCGLIGIDVRQPQFSWTLVSSSSLSSLAYVLLGGGLDRPEYPFLYLLSALTDAFSFLNSKGESKSECLSDCGL